MNIQKLGISLLFPLIIGISSAILTKRALFLYSAQLFFNFFWSIWFFGQGWYLFSFVWLVILWILILGTILSFYKISRVAARLLLPYLLWVTFAGYLNLSIYLLNP